MERMKLYRIVWENSISYREEVKDVAEGKVVQSQADHFGYDPVPGLESRLRWPSLKNPEEPIQKTNVILPRLMLKIDGSMEGLYCVKNAAYRIDVGERVALYIGKPFDRAGFRPHNGFVDALQVLDDEGRVKYQAVNNPEYEFKDPETVHTLMLIKK